MVLSYMQANFQDNEPVGLSSQCKKISRCKLFVRNNPSSEPVGPYQPPEANPPSFAAAPNVGIEDDVLVHDASMDGMDVSMEEVEAPLPLPDGDEDDDSASDPLNAALPDDVDTRFLMKGTFMVVILNELNYPRVAFLMYMYIFY